MGIERMAVVEAAHMGSGTAQVGVQAGLGVRMLEVMLGSAAAQAVYGEVLQ